MQDLRLIALPGERVIKFGYLPPENGFNFKKMSFYVQNRFSQPKLDPLHVNSSNFQAEEFLFSFSKFCLDQKRVAATPLPLFDQFC